jgi:uncharacterized protein (TIGR02391 family)
MKNLRDYLPNPDAVLALEPEELGLVIIRVLNARNQTLYHGGNFVGEHAPHANSGYPDARTADIQNAIVEAWAWMAAQGLVAGKAGGNDWVFVTRRGKRIVDDGAADAYRKAMAMPWHLIHPQINKAAWASFLRGDFQTAVFQAFKEVEVAVREVGGYSDRDIGVDLMRKAFHPSTGPLTDMSLPAAEREGLASLAAGAIGKIARMWSHKNKEDKGERSRKSVRHIITATYDPGARIGLCSQS